MSKEEIIIHKIFDEYGKATGISIDGALLDFLIKRHLGFWGLKSLNQNKDD